VFLKDRRSYLHWIHGMVKPGRNVWGVSFKLINRRIKRDNGRQPYSPYTRVLAYISCREYRVNEMINAPGCAYSYHYHRRGLAGRNKLELPTPDDSFVRSFAIGRTDVRASAVPDALFTSFIPYILLLSTRALL